jgi:arginyl-tRNA synthetase
VIYNRSRIVSILKKFKENVDSKMYSSLPELIQVDLSLLKKPEEKNLLDNYVAKFFPMIESFDVNQVDKIPAKLWNFLLLLSQNYSVYYGRCRSLCVSFFFQFLQISTSSVFIFSGY